MIKTLACDFCKKDEKEVETLVSGPAHVCICNECVDMCNEIIAERLAAQKIKEGE